MKDDDKLVHRDNMGGGEVHALHVTNPGLINPWQITLIDS